MEFSLDNGEAAYRIEAYGEGWLTVNGQLYQKHIVVLPDHIIAPWGPSNLDGLAHEHIKQILAFKPHVILLGTGTLLRFPSPALLARLQAENVSIEVMSTPAACRTYAVLMAEGRKVAAALFNNL